MVHAISIDLGASRAVMAALGPGEPQLVAGRSHSPLWPSALAVGAGGELLAGQAALADDGQALRFFLPRLGEATRLPFNGREYTPDELASLLLVWLREEAGAALGRLPGRAVFAVPLSFGQRQVAALRRAASRAGLFTLGVVPAPLAAALAYSREHPEAPAHTLLVVDFGASSLSVAVVRIFPGALTMLGQAGEAWLGGEDLTQTIVAHLLRRLQGERVLFDESLPARQALRRQLYRVAERAKLALSIVEQTRIHLTPKALGLPAAVDEVLTRAQFEEMAAPRLEEALAVVGRALAEAGLGGGDIDAALLLGGSAHLPLWQALLRGHLPRARVLADANPLTTVAMGAALWAGTCDELRCHNCGLPAPSESTACRRCGASLAGQVRLTCQRCFLPNDPALPGCRTCGASLRPARHAWRRSPHSGRICARCGACVAPGRARCAACRAPVPVARPCGLRCERCGLLLAAAALPCPGCGQVVVPFVGGLSCRDLGIEREGGRMDVILPRGQALPTAQPVHRAFAAEAGRPLLEVPLYEGDKPFACQNERFALLRVALPADAALHAGVRVAFALDRDGLLAVSAALADGSGQALDAWLEWA